MRSSTRPVVIAIVLLSGWIFSGSSCNPRLLVPPAHFAQGDSPGTLPAGRTSAGLGIGTFETFDLFSAPFWGYMTNLEATRGLGSNLDARLLLTSAWMQSKDDSTDYYRESGLEHDIHAAALRVKWNPGRNPLWAMTAGVGAGTSQGQWFHSLEHVQILGFENSFLVPYVNWKWFVSVPHSPRTIRWDSSGHWEPYAKKPHTTHGQEFLAGLKLPLGRGGNPAYLKVEFVAATLNDGVKDEHGYEEEIGLLSATAAVVFPIR